MADPGAWAGLAGAGGGAYAAGARLAGPGGRAAAVRGFMAACWRGRETARGGGGR
jgi:hypothetical protein